MYWEIIASSARNWKVIWYFVIGLILSDDRTITRHAKKEKTNVVSSSTGFTSTPECMQKQIKTKTSLSTWRECGTRPLIRSIRRSLPSGLLFKCLQINTYLRRLAANSWKSKMNTNALLLLSVLAVCDAVADDVAVNTTIEEHPLLRDTEFPDDFNKRNRRDSRNTQRVFK